jgi:hypothetical protein
MTKKLMVVLFASAISVVSVTAGAGTVYQPVTQSGIITPDVATGGNIFYDFGVSTQGDILVCPRGADRSWRDNTCLNAKGENAWTRIQDIVPKGKTYVGFRFRGNGSSVEVYWK